MSSRPKREGRGDTSVCTSVYVGRSCCTSLWAWACLLSLVHSLCQLFYCGSFVGDEFRFEEVLHSLGRTVLTALFSSLKLDASSNLWGLQVFSCIVEGIEWHCT